MKPLSVSCIVLGVVATTLTYLWAEQSKPEEQFVVSIRLLDKSRSDGKVRVLAEPRVATPIGSPFSTMQGQRFKSRTGGADLESGERVSGKLTQLPDGRLHLAITLGRGTHVALPVDADTDLVRTDSLDIQCVLQPGVVKRIDCTNSQTCELRLERMK